MTVSDKIFELIKTAGMSQKDFSEKTGIPTSTISDWKRKGNNPSADKILVICQVLGVTPYELLGETEGGKKADYYIVPKETELGAFIACIHELDSNKRARLQGYLRALKEI